jgi:hypothetical protein
MRKGKAKRRIRKANTVEEKYRWNRSIDAGTGLPTKSDMLK